MAVGSDDGSSSTGRSEDTSGTLLRKPSIPQSSRLLQPTLSWQAKATFTPETFSPLTSKQLENISEHSDRQPDSETQSEASTAAMSTKSLAAPTNRRISSTSWKPRTSRSSDGVHRRSGGRPSLSRQASGQPVSEAVADNVTSDATTSSQQRTSYATYGAQRKKSAGGPPASHETSDMLNASEIRAEDVRLESVTSLDRQRGKLKHVQPNPSPFSSTAAAPFSPTAASTAVATHTHGYASRAASGRLRTRTASRSPQTTMSPQSSGALADTLQQQRAKLKPVQTSTKALLAPKAADKTSSDKASGVDSGTNGPRVSGRVSGEKSSMVRPPQSNASRKGFKEGTSGGTAVAAAASTTSTNQSSGDLDPGHPSTSGPADSNQSRSSEHPGQSLLETVSTAFNRKFGKLTDVLTQQALSRELSLSEVPVPVKLSKGQTKARTSLEEVKASFRSITQASSGSSKSSPARRVSTGAITPAFLEDKTRRDTALLVDLGFPEEGADVREDSSRRASTSALQSATADTLPQSSLHSSEHQPVFSSVQTAVPDSAAASSSTIAIALTASTGLTFSPTPVLASVPSPAMQLSQMPADGAAVVSEPEQLCSSTLGQDVQTASCPSSAGQNVPQSSSHRRQPSSDILTMPSLLETLSTGSIAETSGMGALPTISEADSDTDGSAAQAGSALQPQTSGVSTAVMESMPSFNTKIRMKWNVPKPETTPERTISRMAKQSSIGNGEVSGNAESVDTIKAIGSGMPAAQIQGDASALKGPRLTEEASLKIRGDAIEGPKFVKPSKSGGKGNWLKRMLFCGCAVKE